LRETIASLRKAGEVVIHSLSGDENDQDEFECDRALVLENGNWVIKNLG
jgi:ATP phosphoribosyltransferase regulatory subunit